MECALVLLCAAAMIGGVVFIGRWILLPLDRAARHLQRPTQFTTVDVLCLMFLLQLPLAAFAPLAAEADDDRVWIIVAFGWLASALMWWISVQTLSRAGITGTWHRGVFLALVLPATYFGSFAFVGSLVAIPVSLTMSREEGTRNLLLALLLAAGLLGVFLLCARFTRRMVRDSELPVVAPPQSPTPNERLPSSPKAE